MLKPHGLDQSSSKALFYVMESLSHLNDHKGRLVQLLETPELTNNTDIRALHDLTEVLMEDACFTVSAIEVVMSNIILYKSMHLSVLTFLQLSCTVKEHTAYRASRCKPYKQTL